MLAAFVLESQELVDLVLQLLAGFLGIHFGRDTPIIHAVEIWRSCDCFEDLLFRHAFETRGVERRGGLVF